MRPLSNVRVPHKAQKIGGPGSGKEWPERSKPLKDASLFERVRWDMQLCPYRLSHRVGIGKDRWGQSKMEWEPEDGKVQPGDLLVLLLPAVPVGFSFLQFEGVTMPPAAAAHSTERETGVQRQALLISGISRGAAMHWAYLPSAFCVISCEVATLPESDSGAHPCLSVCPGKAKKKEVLGTKRAKRTPRKGLLTSTFRRSHSINSAWERSQFWLATGSPPELHSIRRCTFGALTLGQISQARCPCLYLDMGQKREIKTVSGMTKLGSAQKDGDRWVPGDVIGLAYPRSSGSCER